MASSVPSKNAYLIFSIFQHKLDSIISFGFSGHLCATEHWGLDKMGLEWSGRRLFPHFAMAPRSVMWIQQQMAVQEVVAVTIIYCTP